MLHWYVLNYDWNQKKVVNQDIFWRDYEETLKKARRNKKFTDYNSLKEYLRRDFQYHYWSKAECEIAVGDVFPRSLDELEKIDMYRQIEMNLDRITEYVIHQLKFRF